MIPLDEPGDGRRESEGIAEAPRRRRGPRVDRTPSAADVARFWRKVKRGDGCWEWIAGRTAAGYGTFSIGSKPGNDHYAHRVSWALTNGPIPRGLHILHECDNPRCVRPEHLRAGTHDANMADAAKRGRTSHQHGQASGKAKFTDEQAAEIRRIYANGGGPTRALGRRFGVNATTIRSIVSGDSYRRAATS